MSGKLHFISAGAGSGKTYRLTQILHAKLSAGEIRPSGVIATTFTRKAATELRERVRSHLLENGAYKIANAMGQARINTVNGVCGDLLVRFAFEAGMSPDQQVLEEAQEKVLLDQAIESVMDGEELAKFLIITRRMSIENWKQDLSNLIKQCRSNDIDLNLLPGFAVKNADDLLEYFPKATKDDLVGQLLNVIKEFLPQLELAAAEVKKKNTNEYLTLVKNTSYKIRQGDDAWSDWVKLAAGEPEKGLISIAEAIGAVAGRYAELPALQKDIRDYVSMQFYLCEKALKAYSNKKLELGLLDFTDQEYLLLKALDNDIVAATLSEEFDLLMVDEFQDTSPIQLALFLKLAKFAKEVYWVGDIKQAIYGFRGSDTTLMQGILDSLVKLGGDKEVLDKSWRSRQPLVNLVNEVFVPAFGSSLQAGEVKLTAERKEVLNESAFGNWILRGSNNNKRDSALVVGIKKLVSSNYQIQEKKTDKVRSITYGDVAIFSRSNSGVNDLAAELRKQGIPTAVLQAGLMQTPEALLTIACLRRLNDPSDTIASAEILSLAACEEPEVWVADRLHLMAQAPEKRPNGYGNEWREVGANANSLLTDLAILRGEMPILSPAEAMQAVIAHGQLSAIVLQWCRDDNEARTRLANLEALLGLASQYEETSRNTSQTASVSGLILWLKDQAEQEQDFLALPAIDAVNVMTHHRSKGLEWPVVILTGLEKEIKDRLWSIGAVSTSTINVEDPLQNRFIRFWPWPFGKMSKVSIAETINQSPIAKSFKVFAIEEEKRLLYVSMTRARDLLIFARNGKDSEESWISTLNADWLLGKEDTRTLELPNGESIPYQHWLLEPLEESAIDLATPASLYWFKEASTSLKAQMEQPSLPLKFNPSSALQQSCTVIESVNLGKRMALKPGVDMAQLGSAIHGCIGAMLTDPTALLSLKEVKFLLKRMGVADYVHAEELLGQIEAFTNWYKSRWPEAIPYAEAPVELKMPNGQVMIGRIDLLLKVHGGWILIDHKSNPGGPDRWDAIAQDYAGQMASYKEAVDQAGDEKVLESWLFLPVAAGAISL